MSEKNKHMDYEDRLEIQSCLNKGMTFKSIGQRIGKDATTVSKEVKKHLENHRNGFVKTEEICKKLLSAPYVCNGCEYRSRNSCPCMRRIYNAKHAQEEYQTVLVESRTGIPLNKAEFYETETIISNAVKQGQHIYHAINANKLPVSQSTVYRHIKKGYYSIAPIDLPRAVKFKPRRQKHQETVPTKIRQGRTYADFLNYIDCHNITSYGELDTVIGRDGGKVIMTIHFVNFDFMAGILLENKTAAEAASKIKLLKEKLAAAGFSFGELFPVMLTDNGGEFSYAQAFENNASGVLETHLFYCDPYASYEKPHIEKNHTLFRDIVPKGSSFDDFTQGTVNLIFSHVNAVKRKQFNGKSAYEMFTFSYSPELASVFGIEQIDPQSVTQSPTLLK